MAARRALRKNRSRASLESNDSGLGIFNATSRSKFGSRQQDDRATSASQFPDDGESTQIRWQVDRGEVVARTVFERIDLFESRVGVLTTCRLSHAMDTFQRTAGLGQRLAFPFGKVVAVERLATIDDGLNRFVDLLQQTGQPQFAFVLTVHGRCFPVLLPSEPKRGTKAWSPHSRSGSSVGRFR